MRRLTPILIRAGVLGVLAAAGSSVAADAPLARTVDGYPNRPLMIMAPANPGGGWDQTSRVMQHVLVSRGIVPVAVEVFNRGGAGGTIGLAALVTRHRRDPHVVMTAGAVMVGAIELHGSPFTIKDTVPLARLTSEFEAVAVPAASPYTSFRDLLDAWKAAPRDIIWGGGSAGGLDHILVGLLARTLGIASEHVRYVAFAGGGEAAAAVMGGQVTAAISGYAEWKGLADSGRMRILSTSSARRLAADAPPTFKEEGVDLTVTNWRCLLAPPGTSAETRAWLIQALQRMRATEEWQAYLKNNYWEDSFLEGPEFERFLDQEIATTRDILATINLGQAGQGYAAVGPWMFPSAALAGLLMAMVFVWRSGAPRSSHHDGPIQATPLALTAVLLAGYAALFDRIGFVLSTALFMTLQARVLGSRHLVRDVIISIIVAVAAFLLFDRLLNVKLP